MIQAHVSRDEQAAQVVLANCNQRAVCRLLAQMLGSALMNILDQPGELAEGLDELRALALLGVDG